MLLPWRRVRKNASLGIKLVLSLFVFVSCVQLAYVHSNKGHVRREDYTGVLYISERNETKVSWNRPTVNTKVASEPKDIRANHPPLEYFPELFFKPPYQPLVHGYPRKKKGYLTIGLPSVKRPNTDRIYLYETLEFIIKKTPEVEQQQITIVVMLSDNNKTYNNDVSTHIYNKYRTFCDSGMILIIQTIDCIYPDLSDVKQTFKDSEQRLKWRAKQNVDFAFLMLYSRNLSEYYMQLEDDIVVATDFIRDIRILVQKTSQQYWFMLEFSRLGFIGKFFRSTDLDHTAMYLLKHYDIAPCDLLIGTLRVERGQKRPIHSQKGLFQHIGRFSSLKDKLMPSLDNSFKDVDKLNISLDLPTGDNPPAFINTSILTYENNFPQRAYDDDNSTFFWGITPRKGDHFTLTFETSHNFSRIIILTGQTGTKKDSFLYSTLMYSSDVQSLDNEVYCANDFHKLVDMADGDIDTMATGTVIPDNIKCLRLNATKNIKNWIIIRDIQLLLKS